MDGSRMDNACCENCFHAQDEKGLLICDLDDRVKDDDMVCKHWIQQD